MNKIKKTFLLGLLCFVLPMPLLAQSQETFTLNFKDAEIKDLIRYVADATGMTVIVDPRVKGRINLISKDEVDEEEMYQLFLAVLQTNGFAAIKNGNVLRIISDKEARAASTPVKYKRPKDGHSDFVTQIIELENVSAVKLIPVLRPLVPPQGHMAAYDEANAIIVVDTEDNVKKIYDIIKSLDKTSANEMEIFKLRHSSADEFIKIVEQVLKQPGGNNKSSGETSINIVADKRSNSMIVTGSDKQRGQVKQLIEKLDGPLLSSGNAQVFRLKHAKAKDLAPMLTKVSQNLSKLNEDAGRKTGGTASTGSIEADEATNSLIITGSGDLLEGVRNVIELLDVPRKQVLVEAIIVEMVASNGKALGLDWMVAGKSGGFGTSNNSNSLAGLVASGGFDGDEEDALDGIGKALAAATGGAWGGVNYDPNGTSFAALITALETTQDANILSTPSLMTLDNNEAEIVVGQEVPFVTGSYTATGNSGSNPGDPFQTIERENVGITLKVTPHINEGGKITLEILQQVSGLVGSANDISDGLIVTNERKIQTTVSTGDREIIVLGGLMRDEVQESVSKIPILGDLPLVGRLFKNSSTDVRKTNLMVFIRPTVIQDSKTALEVSEEQYRLIRSKQLYKKARGVDLFDDDELPELPTWEKRIEEMQRSQFQQEGTEGEAIEKTQAVKQAQEADAVDPEKPVVVDQLSPARDD